MLEILAPAGNYECAQTAIHSGADAIYLGLDSFSARAGAGNFVVEELGELVKEAHFLSVKVYVAMNTIVKDGELEDFFSCLIAAWNVGVDAIIMQDMLLGKAVHEKYPQFTLHLSTQAGVCNVYGAKMAKQCGFSRVILARETHVSEIEKIAAIIETEVFVQGALCTCFSGQCYLSSFAGGNSGNRGRCKQPCRKTYSFDRAGYEDRAYALSLSDLCVGEDIKKFIDAGVVSFKIEGRMRRKEYVAAAVRYYRGILDGFENEKEKSAALSSLKRTYNRGNYTKGLGFGQDKRFLSRLVQGHIGEKIGVVKVINKKYFVESLFKPTSGDAFKILRNGKEVGGAFFLKTEGRGFTLSSKNRLLNGDSVFVTTDSAVNTKLMEKVKKQPISLKLSFIQGEWATAKGAGICVQSEEILPAATTRALTVEEVKNCFLKTDGLPFEIEFESVKVKGNVFLAKSQLNAFRRAFYEKLYIHLTQIQREKLVYTPFERNFVAEKNEKTAVILSDMSGFSDLENVDICIYKPAVYGEELPIDFLNGSFEKFLYFPVLTTQKDLDVISSYLSKIDGLYVENYGGIAFAKEYGAKIFAGTGLNISNHIAVDNLLQEDVAYYAVSKELETSLQAKLSAKNAFSLGFGGLKVMDLCYCPFEKTCATCDQRTEYTMRDENGRKFPIRRYKSAEGICRFEVYNCAAMVGQGVKNMGKLLDFSLFTSASKALSAEADEDRQRAMVGKYTLGHNKNNPLL